MKLYQNQRGNYVVYDAHGKIVIITYHRKHAIAYARRMQDGNKTR